MIAVLRERLVHVASNQRTYARFSRGRALVFLHRKGFGEPLAPLSMFWYDTYRKDEEFNNRIQFFDLMTPIDPFAVVYGENGCSLVTTMEDFEHEMRNA